MNFPRSSKTPGEFLNSLKDKIASQSQRRGRDDYYDDGYYDEPEAEFNDVMIDGVSNYDSYGYDPAYDEYGYSTRSSSSRYQTSAPHLVSSDTARASASSLGLGAGYAETPLRTAQASPRTTERFSVVKDEDLNNGVREYSTPLSSYGEFVSPYKENQANQFASASTNDAFSATQKTQDKQSGLDKLFSPTTPDASAGVAGSVGGASASLQASIDPYQAHESNTAYSNTPTRNVVVIKPITYEDVEGVANAVRAGEIVALVLKMTNDALSKRVLDFSFGVASALDARVEYISEKVFVIMRGTEMTLEEKHELQKQGIN